MRHSISTARVWLVQKVPFGKDIVLLLSLRSMRCARALMTGKCAEHNLG